MVVRFKYFIIFFNVVLLEAYKFLIVCPYAVKSLNMLGEGYVKLLIANGHEVTFISPFPVESVPKNNYRHIHVSQNIQVLSECRNEQLNSKRTILGWFSSNERSDSTLNVNYIMENEINMNEIQYFPKAALRTAKSTFEDTKVKKVLEDVNEKFDAVIVDWFQTDVYAGLAALFECPLIWSYSIGVDWNILRLVDETTNPAFSNDYLSPNIPPYTFKQRAQELWIRIKSHFIKWLFIAPKEKKLYEDVFRALFNKRNMILPNFEDIVYNASLLMINDHQGIGGVPATSQNVKFVGGFHIDVPVKLLPENIKYIMDHAKYGVIYFAMGSTWQSKDMPKTVTEKLLKMFGELNETIIWKYEDELKNVPSNVHIIKWATQQSILAHPNCKLFITHGGILSQIEAIHFGIPTVGVPIYLDQFKNINKAVANGHAIKVDLTVNLAENLNIAIKEIFDDTKYRERVKELSMIYHDRPLLPGAELVHWAEHVVKTRGAPHLRSPALLVPWYQKLYLDLLVLILISSYVVYTTINITLMKVRKAAQTRIIRIKKQN